MEKLTPAQRRRAYFAKYRKTNRAKFRAASKRWRDTPGNRDRETARKNEWRWKTGRRARRVE
jgi:hypothetical protein